MSERERDEEPRPAKKPRLEMAGQRLERGPRPAPLRMSEFLVANLEDFYKPCPSYRLPMEVGAFCHDEEGKLQLDRSQLRYYSPPPPPSSFSRLHMDLTVGYESFASTNKGVPKDGLEPILRWISAHGECFRPRADPKSPTKPTGGADPEPAFSDRPDNLLTNFVTWRGMLTKLLCSPYNKEAWAMAATLHNGTIYFSEILTDEKREREASMSDREKQYCYWGHKFEDYMISAEPTTSAKPVSSPLASTHTAADKPGTVNTERDFCSVVRTRMNTHSVVMAGEVDCCDATLNEKPPLNYVELKTSRSILTDRNKASFKRHKLLKWWAQSFLVGVPRIICGFRDEGGVVRNLQTFRTSDIPKETQHDLSLWQPSVCLNFLDELLTWIRKTVCKDDPRVVYLVEWKDPFSYISCRECPPDSEHVFLPEWYLKKLPPPQP